MIALVDIGRTSYPQIPQVKSLPTPHISYGWGSGRELPVEDVDNSNNNYA